MQGRRPNSETIAASAACLAGSDSRVADALCEPVWKIVTAPEWAAGVEQLASEKWRELEPVMRELGTLGPENAGALEMLCVQYARWRLAEAQVAKLGPVIRAPVTGVPMHNPYLSTANQAADRFIKLAAELGLTPAMRGRVGKRPMKSAASRSAKQIL